MTLVLALLAKVALSSVVQSDFVEITAHGALSSGEHKRSQVMRKEEKAVNLEAGHHFQASLEACHTFSDEAACPTDQCEWSGTPAECKVKAPLEACATFSDEAGCPTDQCEWSGAPAECKVKANTGNATHHHDGTLKDTTTAGNATHHHNGTLKDTSTHAPNGSTSAGSSSGETSADEPRPMDNMCLLNNPDNADPVACTTLEDCDTAMFNLFGSDYSNRGPRMRQCCCQLNTDVPAGDEPCWQCGCQLECGAPGCISGDPINQCVGR